jgi:hypothetical protein
MATCWSCGKEYAAPDLITRESECPDCAAFLRCCRNCEFYDPSAHNECHESQAELQSDKEVANACDYFRAAKSVRGEGRRKKSKSDFDSLFKD